MPIENFTFRDFFQNKSVQRLDRFLLTILADGDPRPRKAKGTLSQPFSEDIKELNESGLGWKDMPPIKAYEVINVSIPGYGYEKETVPNGLIVRSFPVLSFKGFELSIMFEENDSGTIAQFANYCQRRIISPAGYYYHPDATSLGTFMIEVLDMNNVAKVTYIFRDVYYMQTTPIVFDYNNATALPISMTFGADSVEMKVKDSPVPQPVVGNAKKETKQPLQTTTSETFDTPTFGGDIVV